MSRASTQLARAALQTSVRRLVAELGGPDAASTVTRVVRSKVHSYGDASLPDRHMPIDVLLDLETCLGQPLVTQELARLQGFLLAPMQFGEGDVANALSAVAATCGRTLSDAVHALADNLAPDDVRLVIADLTELLAAGSAAIGVLRARQCGEPAGDEPRIIKIAQ